MTAPGGVATSPDGEIVYGHCYASYVQSVSDRDGDPDPYPDITLLNGTAKFEAVFDGVSARGALKLPAIPRSKGVVVSGDTFEIKNSNLVDKEGREGVWLVASVDEVPVTWRITVTLVNERNQTVLNSPYIISEDIWTRDPDGSLWINLPDLIPNPGALTPVEGSALRAAQKTLDEIRVLKGLIDATKINTDTSAASALTYRNEAEGFKNAAETARTGAQTARTGAETARTGAETARTGAQTARTGAETARTGAETAKSQVDTTKSQIDATHGHIHEDVTHADTHAIAAGEASAIATTKAAEANASAGVATTKAAEAAQHRADTLGFRNAAQGAATTATTKAGEATTAATTATEKAAQTAIDALTLAQRVSTGAREIRRTSDGKPYLIPEAQVTEVDLRVDTTVGTRVLLGDTMIYGDTGWRMLGTVDLLNGWVVDNQYLGPQVRRIGEIVQLYIPSLGLNGANATNQIFWSAPSGFRPVYNYASFGEVFLGGTPYRIAQDQSNIMAVGTPKGSVSGFVQWRTNQAWPTSLPGTATT